MNLVVDGIIYTYQKHGGISRMFSEILPRMCDLEPKLTAEILIPSQEVADFLPKHENIALECIPDIERYLRPYRFWKPYYSHIRKLAGRAILGRSQKKIWLSTYYTLPIAWAGLQVLVAYDFVHEKLRQDYWSNELLQADSVIKKKANAICKADFVICISENTRQDLMALYHVPEYKTRVIHLAHKPIFSKLNDLASEPDRKFILYVGNRSKYKDFAVLFRAYANWDRRFEFGLVCVGGGEWTNLELQELNSHGLDSLVKLFPELDDNHLCCLYNQASAFVYPSKYEGFGIPLLEAMACGCPVVASKIPSSIEVAMNIPYYFAPGNSDELIVALNQAIAEGCSSQRIADGLIRSSQYSWENTAKDFLDALKSLR